MRARVTARAWRVLASMCLLLAARPARARDWYRFSGDFDARPCTLPTLRVDDLSADAFERAFRDAERPVVIVGLGPTRARTLERVSREALLEAFGDEVVALSSSNTFSYEKKKKTLRAYVEEDVPAERGEDASATWYWFGDHTDEHGNTPSGFQELFDSYEDIRFVPKDADVAYSFGVGGRYSGVPMHQHGPGWSESLVGRKHWFIAPPDPAPTFEPNVTAYFWSLDALRRGDVREGDGGILECTVHAGEAIYFPTNWWHATLNLDESVFISSFVNYNRRGEREEL